MTARVWASVIVIHITEEITRQIYGKVYNQIARQVITQLGAMKREVLKSVMNE